MIRYLDQIKVLPFKVLSCLLDDDKTCIYNKEFKRRIVLNDEICVAYYVGEFSSDIINYIQTKITHCNILTEYYEFLSSPVNKSTMQPLWHNVSLYEGRNGTTLHTYTSNISIRFFCKQVKTENVHNKKHLDLQENLLYETLISYRSEDDEYDDEYLLRKKKLSAALSKLNERDLKVLDELVVKKQHWQIAFNKLRDILNPKPFNGLVDKDDIINSWTSKQKQDAMSLLKGRALHKLQKAYFSN